ncbi:hypothetical protein ACJX0J_009049, partial [Zea mays]
MYEGNIILYKRGDVHGESGFSFIDVIKTGAHVRGPQHFSNKEFMINKCLRLHYMDESLLIYIISFMAKLHLILLNIINGSMAYRLKNTTTGLQGMGQPKNSVLQKIKKTFHKTCFHMWLVLLVMDELLDLFHLAINFFGKF